MHRSSIARIATASTRDSSGGPCAAKAYVVGLVPCRGCDAPWAYVWLCVARLRTAPTKRGSIRLQPLTRGTETQTVQHVLSPGIEVSRPHRGLRRG